MLCAMRIHTNRGKKTFSRGGGDFMKNEKFEKNEKENCNWYKRAVR